VSQAASRGVPTGATSESKGVTAPAVAGVRLEDVYIPIQDDLVKVQHILRSELHSDTPFVDDLLEHSWLMGGKRIRPVFLLLSGASCGEITPAHLQMAAALEMIHTATLVHDDILDEAETRRHQATTNATWGTKVSVLLGDYLFTHAFHIAALSGSAEALRMLAQASNRVCEGEMRQNAWQGKFDLTEKDYLRMITEKTAELCGVGCQIGAYLSGASLKRVDGFDSYGRNLGVAFQVIDDILDIVGTQDNVGKTLGTDLLNQKPTLPVIHSLENLDDETKAEFVVVLKNASSTTPDILPFLNQTRSIEYAREIAQQHARLATQFAESLESNAFSNSLSLLAQFVLDRTQ